MALALGKVLVLLVLLSSSFTVFSDLVGVAKEPVPVHPPAPAPAPHHKGHHHHHHPPTPPPSHPPVKPPTSPPVKPPSHPPVKPPSSPPVKPPTPPVKPPTPPPVKPPTSPPVKPPTPPVKPPTPPVKPPTPAPVKPPSHPPAKPPSPLPTRKAVAVQGVVYCKSCKYRGVGTLIGASPLAGAVVKLQCNNTKWGLVEQTKTDKNGYFFFKPSKLTTAAFHKCKVFIISSPLPTCSVPTNMGSGAFGAILIPSRKPPVKPLPFQLFTVGPFAFEPAKKVPCHP
ncbi:Hypothetical predicted protein [Olea europaea subsp. europaea]|uniref:Uncharacterized protein n=1 Tax=Olea europaea subsp. europaea TaxID=158383 RepID=A0A8S0R248_OLEEU|nr:Hypothetical predicted protein [Olea europaea subsp. europaea]